MAAGYGVFEFASPKQFGDFAQYAGMDRRTGEIQGLQPAQQGVAPPESLQQMVDQRLGGIQNVGTALNTAMGQAGQGNIMQAVGTIRGAKPPVVGMPMQNTPQPVVNTQYDYTFGL